LADDQSKRWSVPGLGPVEQAAMVVLAFGVVLDRRLPHREHFPGQPFGFWMSPSHDLVRPVARVL
jgi:hypothetical protein